MHEGGFGAVLCTAVRKPQFIEPLQNTSVQEGHGVVLRCTFTGEPPPQIQWLRNDAQILPSAVFKVCLYLPLYDYIRQVNGMKLTDMPFSLLSVCLSVCLCALSPLFNVFSRSSQALSNRAVFWRIYGLSEHLLVIPVSVYLRERF